MPGPFDFLHIKGRTAGSSNELSFDVLDAARSGIDAQKQRARRAPSGLRASQGSYHGVAGTATFSAAPEVERRKKARRVRSMRTWALAVVILAALVGSAAFFGYRFYKEKVDFNGHFNTLIAQFIEIDQTLSKVDGYMQDPFDVPADQREASSSRFDELTERLEGVSREAGEMVEAAPAAEDRSALAEVQSAAQARIDMMAAAGKAFDLVDTGESLAAAAEKAWSLVETGIAANREASLMANEATTEQATVEVRDKTQEALDALTAARNALEEIERYAQGIGFNAEFAYIDKRIESLNAAIASTDALLQGDREAASTYNDAYNKADAESVGISATLTSTPAEKVSAYFRKKATSVLDEYESARSAASTADSALRAYL